MEPFTSNEAAQLLNIHHNHPEYPIGLFPDEIRHLELCVIDTFNELSPAYLRLFKTKDKLELLALMSRKQPYMKS